MPLIGFTTGDILRNKILDKGWYSWEILPVTAPTKDSAGTGMNYKVTFRLIDNTPDLNGKEITENFSSKAISRMIPLICAVRGIKIDEVPREGFQFDTDELGGKKVDGYADTDTYNGQLKNILEQYLPYKSAAGQQVPF